MSTSQPGVINGTDPGVSRLLMIGSIAMVALCVLVLPASSAAQDNSGWMAPLSDGLLISELTIPGTHETMALYQNIWGLSQCQRVGLSVQLNRGIRFLDIRIRCEWDRFSIYHGDFNQYAEFGPDVLEVCIDFLEEHPTETIIMNVQEQSNHHDNDSTFSRNLQRYLEPWPEFIYTSDDYGIIPTLGELRGKIFIVQTCDQSYEHDYCTPIFGPLWNSAYMSIQNDYSGYMCYAGNTSSPKTPGWKWMYCILPQRNAAFNGRHNILYINFTSGSGPPEIVFCGVDPYDLAWGCTCILVGQVGMNRRYIESASNGLIAYVNNHQSPWCWISQREGAVLMDFFDDHAIQGEYLVDLLLQTNPDIPYRNPHWMSQVPDSRLVSELSIPGTHQSLGRYQSREDRCQSLSLETQLKSGIRALDVMCVQEDTLFQIIIYKPLERFERQPAWFGATPDSADPGYRGHTNVLKDCIRFLRDYPTETIIMKVRESGYGAPDPREFWEVFEWYITEDGCNLSPGGEFVRYGDYVWQSDDYGTIPTMGEVRGKIVFLQDFSSPEPFGLPWSGVSVRDVPVSSEDEFQDKWDSLRVDLDSAIAGAPGTIYANFLSGAEGFMDPCDLANGFTNTTGMNEHTYNYLRDSVYEHARIGMIMMDFPGPELIGMIVNQNDLIPTGVDDKDEALPLSFAVSQNYPNPFNPTTTIEYSLSERNHVKIEVFNLLGQHVRTLVDREESAGSYTITWDGKSESGEKVSTGVYLYRFQTGDHSETKKMLLVK